MRIELESILRDLLKSVLTEVAREMRQPDLSMVPTTRIRDQASNRLLLRPSEAADALAISQSHLYNLTRSGKIPSIRVGCLVRYDPIAVSESLGILIASPLIVKPAGPNAAVEASTKRKARRVRNAAARQTSTARRISKPNPQTPSNLPAGRPAPESNRRSSDKPRCFREVAAARLGVDPDRLSVLTYGRVRQITGLDIPSLHGWTYHNRDIPDSAIERMVAFYAAEIGLHSEDG